MELNDWLTSKGPLYEKTAAELIEEAKKGSALAAGVLRERERMKGMDGDQIEHTDDLMGHLKAPGEPLAEHFVCDGCQLRFAKPPKRIDLQAGNLFRFCRGCAVHVYVSDAPQVTIEGPVTIAVPEATP